MHYKLFFLLLFIAVWGTPGVSSVWAEESDLLTVEIVEGIPDRKWDFNKAVVKEKYTDPEFALLGLPTRYSPKAHALDWKTPFVVRATAKIKLEEGKYRLLLRSRSAARLFVDGKLFLENRFARFNQSGHNPVRKIPELLVKGTPFLKIAQREKLKAISMDGKVHTFRLEVFVGSRNSRPELGSPVVAISKEMKPFQVLSPKTKIPFSIKTWNQYTEMVRQRNEKRDADKRKNVSKAEVAFWNRRHEIARKVAAKVKVEIPPKASADYPDNNLVDRFINAKLQAMKEKPNPAIADLAFLRRVTLDITGVTPSRSGILEFLSEKSLTKRSDVIDRLLNDPRYADHWVSYWQDVLAENPALIKPTLNNTGPFRLWLHQAFSDNLPMDRFATELVMMEGSVYQGAPAAFGLATKNDVPMAAKAHILGRAFMGVDMTCARCHDAPYHPFEQKQLFGMAAMLQRKTLKIPATSSVKFVKGERQPLVTVSLRAGAKVQPAWHLGKWVEKDIPNEILRNPKDTRARMAAILTSPKNRLFAKVLVNRVWQRYMGVGIVKDLDDWNEARASHPGLLEYLAQELITHNYDLKHVACLILNSHAYQRQAQERTQLAKDRLFVGPARRRMTAEQLLDSLFVAMGKQVDCEELTFDPECWMRKKNCINLGRPQRAWELVNLSNERDRPALALPITQGYVDLLTAFGWRPSRSSPKTLRENSLTPVQVMTLANGQLMNRLIRLTDDCEITDLCLQNQELPELVEAVYHRILTRSPTEKEKAIALNLLQPGFGDRLTGKGPASKVQRPMPCSWANHLRPEATRIQLRAEQAARAGDPVTPRLDGDWRMRMEDFVWGLLNSPEFVFVP